MHPHHRDERQDFRGPDDRLAAHRVPPAHRTGDEPHLQSAIERIAIDNEPISPARYVETYCEIEPFVQIIDQRSEAGELGPPGPPMSKFEVVTAMAFAAFADAPVDIAVVEVGMGGRWDATNVVAAPVAVITPIGLDHADYLGDSIGVIAAEKAGIIGARDGVDTVAVIGRQSPEAMEVLLAQTVRADAAVAREDSEFAVLHRQIAVGGQVLELQGLGGVYSDIFLPLHGEHQAHNAAVALAAVEAFFGAGAQRQLDIDTVRAGFAAARSPGRLERVRSAPTVFVDAAHNPAGATALAQTLTEEFDFTYLVGVVSVMADKDVIGILTALEPAFDEIVLTHNGSPRALDVDSLAFRAEEIFGPERVIRCRHDARCHRNSDNAGRTVGRRRQPLQCRNRDHRIRGHRGCSAHSVRQGSTMTDSAQTRRTLEEFSRCHGRHPHPRAIVVLLALPVVRAGRARLVHLVGRLPGGLRRTAGAVGRGQGRPAAIWINLAAQLILIADSRSTWRSGSSGAVRGGLARDRVPACRNAPASAARAVARAATRSNREGRGEGSGRPSFTCSLTAVTERTLVLVQPDGVERRLIGDVINRIERKGLNIVALELKARRREAGQRALRGARREAVLRLAPGIHHLWARGRRGAGRPTRDCRVPPVGQRDRPGREATPGTIRGDLGLETQFNLVHGSDSPESAEREIGLWFPAL